jgi:hypothetical protein
MKKLLFLCAMIAPPLVGLGLSLPLWLVVGGLLWLGRAQVKPVVGTVLAWALAFVHVS